MKHTSLDEVSTWCIYPWKLKELERTNGFTCGDEKDARAILQELTFTAEKGSLPETLLDEFRCQSCDDWCIDFPRQLPTDEPLTNHEDCGTYFEFWGAHSAPGLIAALAKDNSITFIFVTNQFPADVWVEDLIANHPSVDVEFIYECGSYRGEIHGENGEVIDRHHIGLA